MSSDPLLTAEMLWGELCYNSHTGIFTRRQDRVGKGRPHKAGDIAGFVHKGHHYVVISVGSRKYLGHRLAWLYVHGAWPSSRLDHKNCVRHDNRIDNLRLATHEQNLRNVPKRITNTSGFKGVSYATHCPNRPWRATTRLDGKHVELGFYATPEEAHAAYKAAVEKRFGEFARTA